MAGKVIQIATLLIRGRGLDTVSWRQGQMSATSQVPPTSERRAIRREGESQGILIVDDDELILRSMDRVLRRQAQEAGWDLHFVSDGNAALEVLTQRSFSVA